MAKNIHNKSSRGGKCPLQPAGRRNRLDPGCPYRDCHRQQMLDGWEKRKGCQKGPTHDEEIKSQKNRRGIIDQISKRDFSILPRLRSLIRQI